MLLLLFFADVLLLFFGEGAGGLARSLVVSYSFRSCDTLFHVLLLLRLVFCCCVSGRYGRSGEVSRVAIVDIDIHHGNGTEEIVR